MNGKQTRHFLSYYKDTITRKWNDDAIEDYKGTVKYTFGEMAEQMARLGVLFKNAGIKKGDKIALCSPNSTNWAVTFLAVAAYEGVGVSIMANFATETIEGLVNHSDSRILFAAQNVQNQVNPANMPHLEGIVSLDNFGMVYGTEAFTKAINNWESDFKAAYPNGFSKEDLNYNTDNLDQLALINYTSGTTSSPKGVMLTYRSISSNSQFAIDIIPIPEGGKMLELLPMAHMFGLMFEFIYQLAGGAHVVVLTKTPAPQILMQALHDAGTQRVNNSATHRTDEFRVGRRKTDALLHKQRRTHNGAVNGNQRQEYTQRRIQRRAEPLNHHLNQLNNARNHTNKENEAQKAQVDTFDKAVRPQHFGLKQVVDRKCNHQNKCYGNA